MLHGLFVELVTRRSTPRGEQNTTKVYDGIGEIQNLSCDIFFPLLCPFYVQSCLFILVLSPYLFSSQCKVYTLLARDSAFHIFFIIASNSVTVCPVLFILFQVSLLISLIHFRCDAISNYKSTEHINLTYFNFKFDSYQWFGHYPLIGYLNVSQSNYQYL